MHAINKVFEETLRSVKEDLQYFFRWSLFSVVTGFLGGSIGASFVWLITTATSLRGDHKWLLFLLPFSGLIIVGLYDIFHEKGNKGTNTVIEYIINERHIDAPLAPLVYVGTFLSHLTGASVGREGAALQIGGSLGETLGKIFHLNTKDSRMAVMTGMSALFAAVFGTPVAAAIFPIEVCSVGIMHYSAMLPCIFASFTGYGVSLMLGTSFERFDITDIPPLDITSVLYILVLGILCGLLSSLFCFMLHKSEALFKHYFENYYKRAAASALIFIALTLILHTDIYMGASSPLLASALKGDAPTEAFFFKMLFTAIAIGGRFKGGEIVPTFCTGACFGAVLGNLFGFSPSLCAACGMVALFAGVTNCPVSTLIISLEMLDASAMPYYSIVIAAAYVFSGYSSLYSAQRIIYSKTRNEYIFHTPKENDSLNSQHYEHGRQN